MTERAGTRWPSILVRADADPLPTLRAPAVALVGAAAAMTLGLLVVLMLGDRLLLVSHVSDDAYYYFNVAAHLAAGDGPTADGVTKTTGWHPLYGVLLAGMHQVLNPSLDGFVRAAVAFNVVCFVLTGGVLALAARRWWGRVAGFCAGVFWLTNPHALMLAGVALEGSVYGLTLALLVWRLVEHVRTDEVIGERRGQLGSALVVGVCGGLVLLSRTDALVLVPLVAVVVAAAGWERRGWGVRVAGALVASAIAVAMLAGWWWYAWKHTGDMSQGSGAVKMLWREGMNAEAGTGWAVVFTLSVFGDYLLKLAVKVPAFKWVLSALPGLFRGGITPSSTGAKLLLHLLWVFPVGLGLAYAMFIDRPRTWYYVPALLGISLMSAGAAQVLITTVPTNRLQRLARSCLPLMAWLIVIEVLAIFGRNMIATRSRDQVMGALAAQWVDQHMDSFVDEGERLGCWHSGIVQYYTPRHTVINLDGLANNDILRVLRGELTMNEYWDERNIRVILGEPREKMGTYEQAWGDKHLAVVESFRAGKGEVTVKRVERSGQ